MEVIASLSASLALINWAIDTARDLKRLAHSYAAAHKHIYKAFIVLNAQQCTLLAIQTDWERELQGRGARRASATIDDQLIWVWGQRDYMIVQEHVIQLKGNIEHAYKSLKSIDSDLSFPSSAGRKPTPHPPRGRTTSQTHTEKHKALIWLAGGKPKKSRMKDQAPLQDREKTSQARRRHSEAASGADALNEKLGSINKVRWSIQLREELKQNIDEIDIGIARIKRLAKLLFKNSAAPDGAKRYQSENVADPKPVKDLAKVQVDAQTLHKALVQDRSLSISRPDLTLRLERDYSDPSIVEQFLPQSVVLGRKNESNKFLLLALDNRAMLAETFSSAHPQAWSFGRSPQVGGLEEVRPGDLVEQIMDKLYKHDEHREHQGYCGYPPCFSGYHSNPFHVPEPPFRSPQFDPHHRWSQRRTPSPPSRDGRLIIQKPGTTIILHPLINTHLLPLSERQFQQSDSIMESLKADPHNILHMLKKRLSIATTIASGVLNLYDTGWLPSNLSLKDLYFHNGKPRYGYSNSWSSADDDALIQAWTSPTVTADAEAASTPFDCVRQDVQSQAIISPRDRRISTLFHRLGIALFELGLGKHYTEVFPVTRKRSTDPSTVYSAVEEICFGRPYRQLVTLCLTGRLCSNSVVGPELDERFNEQVIQKLRRLERHMTAIIQDRWSM